MPPPHAHLVCRKTPAVRNTHLPWGPRPTGEGEQHPPSCPIPCSGSELGCKRGRRGLHPPDPTIKGKTDNPGHHVQPRLFHLLIQYWGPKPLFAFLLWTHEPQPGARSCTPAAKTARFISPWGRSYSEHSSPALQPPVTLHRAWLKLCSTSKKH